MNRIQTPRVVICSTGKTTLHERGERLSAPVVAGKSSFNVLFVGVCVVEHLTGGAV